MNDQPSNSMKDYTEIQMIRNWLLWIILFALLLFFTFASVSQLVFGIPMGENPMPSWALIAGTLFIAFITVVMAKTQLILSIDSKSLSIRFGALGQMERNWSEVSKVKIIKMPLAGVGKKNHPQYGELYNAGGKQGLLIEFKDQSKVLVSTRQAEKLKAYLKQIKKLKDLIF